MIASTNRVQTANIHHVIIKEKNSVKYLKVQEAVKHATSQKK